VDDLKDIVTNIGAFAGFAAVVGLAVLSMLYFSQARDVRRLREWAGRAPEREAEVQQLAQQLASQAIADMWAAMPETEPEPAVAQQTATESVAEQAEPPPDVGADEAAMAAAIAAEGEEGAASTEWSPDQPLANDAEAVEEPESGEVGKDEAAELATIDVPDDEPLVAAIGETSEHEAQSSQDQPIEETAVAASVHQPTEEVNVLELDDEPAPAEATRPSRLAPSTPAAARAGRAPAPPGGGQTTGPRLPLPPLDEYRSTAAESIGAGAYTTTGHTSETTFSDFERERNLEERRSSGSRAPFWIAGALVVAFGALLLYTQIGGGGEEGTKKAESAQQTEAQRRAASGANPRINRPAVQVVVLNGTDIPGLAAVTADQVDQAGFTLKNYANREGTETFVESVVYYAPGKKPEAEEVAKELQIDSVKEVDAETAAAAGGNSPVIVVTGSDREQ
jgi:hypothetical protein